MAMRIWLAQLCLLLWLVSPGAVHGAIIINAPMTDTNASGWVLGGNPTSAQLTGNGTIDPVGSGWLRITNNSGNQTGFAYNTTTFDLSAGLLIQFDDASWGGTGADGFSVFLFDAGVPAFNIGALIMMEPYTVPGQISQSSMHICTIRICTAMPRTIFPFGWRNAPPGRAAKRRIPPNRAQKRANAARRNGGAIRAIVRDDRYCFIGAIYLSFW